MGSPHHEPVGEPVPSRPVRMHVTDPDETLMARVAQGDHAACRTLVDRHLARILAFASRTLGDRAEAEDVAQEVFTRLWIHAGRWQPGAARLSTWLHRVALNLCLDILARKRQEPLDGISEPIDSRPEGVTLMQERELQERVGAALHSLPPNQKAAVVLCHYQGFRNAEAADLLGVSVEALESLLARARRTLRERLRAVAPELLGS
jgi:RNA polymerase sigma-70 factor (ECF subfamily)